MADDYESRVLQGEILITLKEKGQELEYWLKPTLGAATAISRQYGGFGPARAQLASENFDACAFILRQGLSWSDKKARDLPDILYDTGITADLLIALITFVAVLANGGKPVVIRDIDDDAAKATEGN